jgi:ribosomal protein S18 acetylase RimI-like enzyme
MVGPSWRPIPKDVDGAVTLLDEAVSDARRSGQADEAQAWASLEKSLPEGRTEGAVMRGADGHPWGVAIWTPLKGIGRRVSPTFVAKAHQDPTGWTEFLRLLLEAPDPAGPPVVLNFPMPGIAEPDAAAFLVPRGFRAFHRFDLVFPAAAPLPPEPNRPLSSGQIRPLTRADAEPLATLGANCYANSIDRFLFGEETDALVASREILRMLFDGRFGTFAPEASFGLDIDGKLLGATIVTRRPTHWLLADVEVDPSVQGRGHAHRLVRATLEALAPQRETPLGLSVTRENAGAFRLYQRLGFIVRPGSITFWANPDALGIPSPGSWVGERDSRAP